MTNLRGADNLILYAVIVVVVLFLLLSLASYHCHKRVHLSASRYYSSSIATDQTSTGIAVGASGFDEATIAGYPKLLYSKVKSQYGSSISSSTASCCSICLADYKEEDLLMVLPDCGHLFHVKCVYPWLRLHATCPICRNSPSPVSLCISCSQVAPLPVVPL